MKDCKLCFLIVYSVLVLLKTVLILIFSQTQLKSPQTLVAPLNFDSYHIYLDITGILKYYIIILRATSANHVLILKALWLVNDHLHKFRIPPKLFPVHYSSHANPLENKLSIYKAENWWSCGLHLHSNRPNFNSLVSWTFSLPYLV